MKCHFCTGTRLQVIHNVDFLPIMSSITYNKTPSLPIRNFCIALFYHNRSQRTRDILDILSPGPQLLTGQGPPSLGLKSQTSSYQPSSCKTSPWPSTYRSAMSRGAQGEQGTIALVGKWPKRVTGS